MKTFGWTIQELKDCPATSFLILLKEIGKDKKEKPKEETFGKTPHFKKPRKR